MGAEVIDPCSKEDETLRKALENLELVVQRPIIPPGQLATAGGRMSITEWQALDDEMDAAYEAWKTALKAYEDCLERHR